MTSIGRIRAFGAAPACPAAEPAAMPATNVPWPRPSPGEFGVAVLRLTLATTRPLTSGLDESTPESTIAIAGKPVTALPSTAPQRLWFPDSSGQTSFEVY